MIRKLTPAEQLLHDIANSIPKVQTAVRKVQKQCEFCGNPADYDGDYGRCKNHAPSTKNEEAK